MEELAHSKDESSKGEFGSLVSPVYKYTMSKTSREFFLEEKKGVKERGEISSCKITKA